MPGDMCFRILASLALLFIGSSTASGQAHAGHDLGEVDFQISCSTEARTEFNRAVALLHHMTYPQARAAFERVSTIDPKCAMAHWGVAMTLFQPLWPTRPSPPALQRGWDLAQKAKELAPPMEQERLFIAAVEAFYLEPTSTDYWLRIRRWEQAMKKLYDAFPDASEPAAFYALAHLATTRADTITTANADRAAEVLLGVYKRHPNHPGAMHYLVHANDVPTRERESLDITRRYDGVAPRNPHALHMPTHIYTRLGDWDAVVQGNIKAAEAALEHPAGERGEYVWDEFPHAVEYLVYAYLQKGADDSAAAVIRRLRATPNVEPTFKLAFHLASTQARYALERRDWKRAAAIVPRDPSNLAWDRFPWAEAIAHFARGLGAAHLNDLVVAQQASARLDALEQATRQAGEGLFARNIRILLLELNAWIAHVQGRPATAVELMRDALQLENTTPKHAVTPGPTIPASELLGDLLLEQKRYGEALFEYQHALEHYPRRYNSVLGAARAARADGKVDLARTLYRELIALGPGNVRTADREEAGAFVRGRQ
jgi:tetratricopeptide (TPR) repeat protein